MKKVLLISAIVIAALVVLGVAGYATAKAQLPPVSAFPFGPSGEWEQGFYAGMKGGRHRGGSWGDGFHGWLFEYMSNAIAEAFDLTPEEFQGQLEQGKTPWDLAQERGLTEEQFRDLMVEACTSALEQAVAEDAITQEQADWMLERLQGMGEFSGKFGFGGWGRRGGHGHGMGGRRGGAWGDEAQGPIQKYMLAAMAEAFDLTPEELQAMQDEGKTLWDLAQEEGLSVEEFRARLIEARTEALEQAVEEGVITQEQADWMRDRWEQRWDEDGAFGPCPGDGSGHGPGWRWNPQPSQPESRQG